MIAPSRMPCICRSISAKTSTESKNARKMARPPIRGIGTLCMRRLSFGTSIAPTLYANVLTSGVEAKDTTAATDIARSMKTTVRVVMKSPHQRATKPTFL